MRPKSSFRTCVMGVGRLPKPSAREVAMADGAGAELTTDSTKVFHPPQSGQRPVHFGCSLPHCWHTKMVRLLDFVGIMFVSF
jgi:hypothetical protein